MCKVPALVANMALRPAHLAARYRVVKDVLFASIKPEVLLVWTTTTTTHTVSETLSHTCAQQQRNPQHAGMLKRALQAERIDTATKPPYAAGSVQGLAHALLTKVNAAAARGNMLEEMQRRFAALQSKNDGGGSDTGKES